MFRILFQMFNLWNEFKPLLWWCTFVARKKLSTLATCTFFSYISYPTLFFCQAKKHSNNIHSLSISCFTEVELMLPDARQQQTMPSEQITNLIRSRKNSTKHNRKTNCTQPQKPTWPSHTTKHRYEVQEIADVCFMFDSVICISIILLNKRWRCQVLHLFEIIHIR